MRATAEDLIDVDALVSAYYDQTPDPENIAERVTFGTSGHRGSSLDRAFNEAHIIATTAAIVEYRRNQGIDGPLYIGRDTHALSLPAWQTALEVLIAADVHVMVDARDSYTPTPAVSHAILLHNGATTADGVRTSGPELADGIVVTPSHNPPRDGGFKYNPPHGGPADSDATTWIANRANDILRAGVSHIARIPLDRALNAPNLGKHDYLSAYVDDLASVLNLDAIRESGLHIGADPLGGAAVEYWGAIGERYGLNLTVVNPQVDPRWGFMTLDWDAKIRMDCSSPYAMASLVDTMSGNAAYDIATGNDADADRHGIVTPDAGLMNPNHYLAVAIHYLFSGARPQWGTNVAIGKTLVSSALIDRVAHGLQRQLLEVPVGFKWFVPGLINGTVGFGGEESAGASFLRADGTVWTTDKDGILLALLASEITAVTGKSPSQHHTDLTNELGSSWYARIDAPATREQKSTLAQLSPDQVTATTLAGDPITERLTTAPGNNAAIGGLKVTTDNAWFAARPSGTEDVYKIYAESFVSADHLATVQTEAKNVVSDALNN
ncbi:phosphoglucomutase, alpha-D-glucose phosphate- specific [Jonesia denitrificans DSM 20603]|uniref:Phosphoglucomutase, alpha-D-glucose phosphate-specific n=2 Tax=Jonesia TaxID=43673 RepID=C7QZ24_JONDD|nr:phosphoglucomutase, alpha-D-glucose phosphate- specific [Jonesia denitrificans DSM 20603]SQH19905.1 Phosphoglucomutase [Jonesia denitrificans]